MMKKITENVRSFVMDPLGEGFLLMALMLLVMFISL
jgi:hypothetical protein